MSDNRCEYKIQKLGRKCKRIKFKDFQFCRIHLKNMKPIYNLPREDTCIICTEEYKKTEPPLLCGHYIHRRCIVQWGKEECPICRNYIPLTKKELDEIKNKRDAERVLNAEAVDENVSDETLINILINTVGVEHIIGMQAYELSDESINQILRHYMILARLSN